MKIIVRFEVKSRSHIEKVKKPSEEQLKMLVVYGVGFFVVVVFPYAYSIRMYVSLLQTGLAF